MYVLVDTDVVSYGLRSDPLFQTFYGPALVGKQPLISFMTMGELEYGASLANWGERRIAALRTYLSSNFTDVVPTHAICRQWGQLMAYANSQGRVLHVGDGWIAATAVTLAILLMTNNRRDFDYLPDLQLITYAGDT